MSTVKTTISLPKPLFEQVKRLAQEMKTPLSHIVAQALEQYFERRESQSLLDKMNAAHAGGLDPDDKRFLDAALRRMAQRAKEENW